MKKFLALLMALTLCLSMAVPAFAAETVKDSDVSNGVVVYEDDRIVVYDTRTNADARAMIYGYAWFDGKGALQEDEIRMQINSTGSYGITFGIESSSSSAYAYCMIQDPQHHEVPFEDSSIPLSIIGNVNGRWVPEAKHRFYAYTTGTWIIDVDPVFAPEGTRVMCWIY